MTWTTTVTAGYESGYSTEAHNKEDEWPGVIFTPVVPLSGRAVNGNGARDTSIIVPIPSGNWRCGFWVSSAGPAFSHPVILLAEDSSNQTVISIGYNELISLNINGVTMDYVHDLSTPMATGHACWTHVGFCYVEDTCSFYINGERYLTAEHESLSMEHLWIFLAGFSGSLYVLDDFYMQSGSGGEADLAPPALRFHPMLVQQTLQSEWMKVPDTLYENADAFDLAPDDQDLTYVTAFSAGFRDRYRFYNVPMEIPDIWDIKNVTIQAAARNLGTGSIKFFATNGVDESLSAAKPLETTYEGSAQYVMDVDPSGDPWTNDSVSQAEYGIESAG